MFVSFKFVILYDYIIILCYIISHHIIFVICVYYILYIFIYYIIMYFFLFWGMTPDVIQPEFIDRGLTLITFRLIVLDFVHPNPSHFISLNDH